MILILLSVLPFNTYCQLNGFGEQLFQQIDPQGFSYYEGMVSVDNHVVRLVDKMNNSLEKNKTLLSSENPEEILTDFNTKMANIKLTEQSMDSDFDQLVAEQFLALGNQLSTEDFVGSLYTVKGLLDAGAKRRDSRAEIERQRAKLKKEKEESFNNILKKAIEANDRMKLIYHRRAAFAETEEEENYNRSFIEHLDCYQWRMINNFSLESADWLINTCHSPILAISTSDTPLSGPELSEMAESKMLIFDLERRHEVYREAAVSLLSAAIKKEPKVEYYFRMAEFYIVLNLEYQAYPVEALLLLNKVQKMDASYNQQRRKQLQEMLIRRITKLIKSEIDLNYAYSLKPFIEAGLDRSMKIEGDNVLVYAIKNDQASAVEAILELYKQKGSEKEHQQRMQKAIILCAANDSYSSMVSFIASAQPVDFVYKSYSPIEVAFKTNSIKTFDLLYTHTLDTAKYAHLKQLRESLKSKEEEEEISKLKVLNRADVMDMYRYNYWKLSTEQLLALKINPYVEFNYSDYLQPVEINGGLRFFFMTIPDQKISYEEAIKSCTEKLGDKWRIPSKNDVIQILYGLGYENLTNNVLPKSTILTLRQNGDQTDGMIGYFLNGGGNGNFTGVFRHARTPSSGEVQQFWFEDPSGKGPQNRIMSMSVKKHDYESRTWDIVLKTSRGNSGRCLCVRDH